MASGSADRRWEALHHADAIACITELFARHEAVGKAVPAFVVLVGGTALAARGIRDQTEDIDFYAPTFDDEIVEEAERRMRDRYGDSFKIDATTNENIWGEIIIRDIADSPELARIVVGTKIIVVKVLTLADLYLLKVAAGRDKDERDLDALAPHVALDVLLSRFTKFAGWLGSRHHLIGYADRFLTGLGTRFGVDELEIVDRLAVPSYVREALSEARRPGHDV